MSDPSKLSMVLAHVPADILERLEAEYVELERRFALRDWGPAELNGGRFAEAVLRLLEWKRGVPHTAFGTPANRSAILNAAKSDTSLPDAYRFHIPMCVELLMDVRNKRNVAHLGDDISVNEIDSTLVLGLASWALAEIVRVESAVDPAESQRIIDSLAERSIPLVEEVGGELVVLATNLNTAAKVLVALYHEYPRPMKVRDLQSAVGYGHSTRFRALLASEASERTIHIKGDLVYLTRKGTAWVEQNVRLDLAL
jgi:hypothetical protein